MDEGRLNGWKAFWEMSLHSDRGEEGYVAVSYDTLFGTTTASSLQNISVKESWCLKERKDEDGMKMAYYYGSIMV